MRDLHLWFRYSSPVTVFQSLSPFTQKSNDEYSKISERSSWCRSKNNHRIRFSIFSPDTWLKDFVFRVKLHLFQQGGCTFCLSQGFRLRLPLPCYWACPPQAVGGSGQWGFNSPASEQNVWCVLRSMASTSQLWSPTKPQLLLAEGNQSSLIVYEAKMLRDSKHMGFCFFFCSCFCFYFLPFQYKRPISL